MEYHIIYTIDGEFSGPSPKYIAASREEAEAHIMEFCDWYCLMGTCEIRTVDERFKTLKSDFYCGGELVKERG